MEAKQISKAVIKRLPRYYRYLGELLEDNVERISSNDLSKKMRVTASQIRQDLNNFGGFGQQGYGYNVKYLYTEIGKILGLDEVHPMIIIGAGNLGQALANYVDFEKRGFKLEGIFDVNPVLEGIAVRGIEIQMISNLPFFLREKNIEIAILTLPKNKAKDMADILIENGIKAIWNFAHIDLETPEDVIVENVHLSESLMTLSYNLSQYRQEHVEADLGGIDLNDLRYNFIKEITVMGDDKYSTRIIQKISFQPGNTLHVEVVGRLIEEKNVRLGDQEFTKSDTGLLSTGEGFDLFGKIFVRKAKTLEDTH